MTARRARGRRPKKKAPPRRPPVGPPTTASTAAAVGSEVELPAGADGAAPDDPAASAAGAPAVIRTADWGAHDPGTTGTAPKAGGATDASAAERLASDIYSVRLDVFEGPLDLLLHLIQKHELDIFDIPVRFITTKYLEYLGLMRTMQIDVASEYLVMAATLAYIKSQLLLPDPPAQLGEGEEGAEPPDPRAELVRRLLEYQKYRDAAARLAQQPMLGRDVFGRDAKEPEPEGPAPFAPVNVFKLFEIFDQVLKRAGRKVEHEVVFDRVSITERIVELTELLQDRGRVRFEEFFLGSAGDPKKMNVSPAPFTLVVTFMAMLEMCRLGVARIAQEGDSLGDIYVEFAARGSRLPARHPSPRAEPGLLPPTDEELAEEGLDEESFDDWLASRAAIEDDAEGEEQDGDEPPPSEPPDATDEPPPSEPPDATDEPPPSEPPDATDEPLRAEVAALVSEPNDGSEEHVS